MTTVEKIRHLIDNNVISKYTLAKRIEVSWNTIHMWYRGVFEPSDKYKDIINNIYKESL